jgi:hypothetical protein
MRASSGMIEGVLLDSLGELAPHLVFKGPVSRLEKDQDQTGARPIRTKNSQDQLRP